EESALPDMDFDIPDDTESTEELDATEESALPDMDFDIPDNTETSDETISESDTIEEDNPLSDMDFNLPDDNDNDTPEMPDDFFNTEDDMKDTTFDSESPAAGLNFDGLYDEETERGTPAQNEADEVKKKTKVPVIICIICAIICIIATALILFIIPSKYNLLTKKNAKNIETTVAIEEPAPQPEPVAEPEPEPEPAVPEAKEDEIIIIEKAEEVVPAQPPVAEEKPKDIVYKIKWGDTLWDIADTYYKNPWRYKYIARYNGIKNPDYIISGTKIVIPAE
ncbi:LysM domain-containing protein, partial [Treponema bryantii]